MSSIALIIEGSKGGGSEGGGNEVEGNEIEGNEKVSNKAEGNEVSLNILVLYPLSPISHDSVGEGYSAHLLT